jgi:hypothetical protein
MSTSPRWQRDLTYLAVEELVNGLSSELGTFDGFAVDCSGFLLAETGDLSGSSLGKVFVVRLGDLLGLLLGSGSGGNGSLTLGGTPSTIGALGSGSLRSVVLILSILLALLLGYISTIDLVAMTMPAYR